MNKLFYGDNLDVIRKFIRPICVETVDLCYIDPPFNSRAQATIRFTTTSAPTTQEQAQAFTETWTWTWDDQANQCYEDIQTNKNGVQTQQSIALINGLEKVLGKGSPFSWLGKDR